jgi:hypothetical protein
MTYRCKKLLWLKLIGIKSYEIEKCHGRKSKCWNFARWWSHKVVTCLWPSWRRRTHRWKAPSFCRTLSVGDLRTNKFIRYWAKSLGNATTSMRIHRASTMLEKWNGQWSLKKDWERVDPDPRECNDYLAASPELNPAELAQNRMFCLLFSKTNALMDRHSGWEMEIIARLEPINSIYKTSSVSSQKYKWVSENDGEPFVSQFQDFGFLTMVRQITLQYWELGHLMLSSNLPTGMLENPLHNCFWCQICVHWISSNSHVSKKQYWKLCWRWK